MKRKTFFSIKLQIMTISIILIVLPVVSVGFLSYTSVQKTTIEAIEENLGKQSISWQNIASSYVMQIENILERFVHDIAEGDGYEIAGADLAAAVDVEMREARSAAESIGRFEVGKARQYRKTVVGGY